MTDGLSSKSGSIDLDPCLPNDRSRSIDVGFDLGGKLVRGAAEVVPAAEVIVAAAEGVKAAVAINKALQAEELNP